MRSYEQTSLNRAVRVTSSRVRREDRCSISSFLSRRPRWGNWVSSRHVHGPSCFLIFLLFDRAAGFLPPRPREAKAGARRCGQGWPGPAAPLLLPVRDARSRCTPLGMYRWVREYACQYPADSQGRGPVPVVNRRGPRATRSDPDESNAGAREEPVDPWGRAGSKARRSFLVVLQGWGLHEFTDPLV